MGSLSRCSLWIETGPNAATNDDKAGIETTLDFQCVLYAVELSIWLYREHKSNVDTNPTGLGLYDG